jgi:GH15 family glucan-1,4-alpha-glucosidase
VRIEDYALIGDLRTAALVGRNGSIDWFCPPRFDSEACFAALLGDEDNGYWRIGPADGSVAKERRYREGTLILETEFETDGGSARVVDCMPIGNEVTTIVRIVRGLSGTVQMRMDMSIRLDYGATIPWVEDRPTGLVATAGPDSLYLRTPVETRGERYTTVADFEVREGERIGFTLSWHPSHLPDPHAVDAVWAVRTTEHWWREWSGSCNYQSEWRDQVVRSLITLKALTYDPTGAVVAAPTTSLPEALGGERNWDYRYCWLRDSALTVDALVDSGYLGEAIAFRNYMARAVAGHPSQVSVLYGLAGEREVPERELPHLPGYEASKPVRVGNAAADQFQLDVYGEILDAAHRAREIAQALDPRGWRGQLALVGFVEGAWQEPDEGIWEVRGPRRHFTHSKVMAWVALDRAVRTVENFKAEGPVDRWRELRDVIHADVLENGYDPERNTFTQYYGSEELDASTLLVPAVGFLPGDDKRVIGTIEAISSELMPDGFVRRYSTHSGESDVDGLSGVEGAFLPCTFWLADALMLAGKEHEARQVFERALGVGNDLGLFAEEYEPGAGRMLGNFPQAFTHLALINTAYNLSHPVRRAAAAKA